MTPTLTVAIPLFPQFTALDAVGPYEVLQRIPFIDVVFVGQARCEYRSENGMLGMVADATFAELRQPDVLVFPGASAPDPSNTTKAWSSGSVTRIRPPGSLHRCAPARWCSAPPGCCTT